MIARFFLGAGLILVTVSCTRHEPASTIASADDTQQSVPVVRAAVDNLSGVITLTGEFIPFQEVDVMSKVAGYIKSINVDVGDRVRTGQVLATLEVPEMEDELTRAAAAIEQANAESTRASDEIRRAESAQQMAHLSFTRIESVAKRQPGLVPQQEVDEIRARDLQTQAQVSAAKSALLAAEERSRVMRADLARLKTMHKYQTITAPFDGVVTKRYANTGAMIQAGTTSQSQAMPVVKLSQNNLLRLILPVPESSVSQVSIGQRVDVRVSSLNRTFPGKVARFTDKLQVSTRTMDTEVDVPNASLSLIPGMYAEVDLRLQERQNVVTVPVDAIEGSGTTARVFAVAPPGQIHIVPVMLGLQTARLMEIQQGIKEGQMVVVGRRGGLKEGDRVRPVIATFVNPEPGK
jgi:RND family efflux transporter MFP subunit